jgi:hypothetical protein
MVLSERWYLISKVQKSALKIVMRLPKQKSPHYRFIYS